jgi:hypothetical protein
MSSVNLQPSRALKVIASDTVDIPYPNVMCEGLVTAIIGGGIFEDNSKNFEDIGVSAGDILYFPDNSMCGYVVSVRSDIGSNVIEVTCDIPSVDAAYTIYKGGQNRGCTLYIPGAPVDISVVTQAGNDVSILSAPSLLPVHVKRVKVTGSVVVDNIIALW